MRAVAVMEPGRVEIVELSIPQPGPYQALVRNEVGVLCNATDSKLVAGHFPGVDRYPLVLGHESAGTVVAVGSKVRHFREGDRAIGGLLFDLGDERFSSGWGGFCEFTLVNDHDAMVQDGVADEAHGWLEVYEIQRRVEADIPVREAALLCTWREVLAGFGDFGLKERDDIMIFGAGPVGLSFVTIAKQLGLGYVGVVEPDPKKRQRAERMGAQQTFAPGSPEIASLARNRGKPLDAVIDAVGSVAIVNAALPLIKMGGTVGVYGVISDPALHIAKDQGPYNFNLMIHQWPTRWREAAAQAPLCDWIRKGNLLAADFITHEFDISAINDALDVVKRGEALKVLLRFES